MANTTIVIFKELASQLVGNPIAFKDKAAWRPVLSWLRRPVTLFMLIVAHAYVFANHISHRLFIRRIFEFWEDYDGIKSGTGIYNNEIAVTLGTILLIPLGIILASCEIARDFSIVRRDRQDKTRIISIPQPWIQASQLWVVWLAVVNFLLFKLLSGDSDLSGFFEATILFSPIAFFGGWLGLALPTFAARVHSKRYVRFISCLALILGFSLALPQLLSQAIHVEVPYRTYMKLLWSYNFSVVSVLPYLGLMLLLFPIWLRWSALQP